MTERLPPPGTSFPADFVWGAATSAYQIEGSPLADGAGASIWHRFVHTPGRVKDGDTGDVACDHYRRMEGDVALMAALGLKAYRFSIAWGRVLPAGRGAVNPAGLSFYERLVDTLLAHGIQPMPTLYHWDLPAALDDRGGWLNPDIADWFADYARVMFRALGDRVTRWTTLNEPWVAAHEGYLLGTHAPGHRSPFAAPVASHNLLRAHGAGVQAFRAEARARAGGEIGLVVNLEPKYPASTSPDDLAATRRAEAYMNRQYLDPVFHGRYPDELRDIFGDAWPDWPQADMDLIRQPIDFLGVNYYTRSVTRHDPTAWPLGVAAVRQPRSTHSETGWEDFPQGLADTLLWVAERYTGRLQADRAADATADRAPLPIYITENGSAYYDPPTAAAGRVVDPLRIAYLRGHLLAVRRAIGQGVDVRGYMAWSLFDNLEWAHGFSKRFGLVHVDFDTQVRTPKDSAAFYSAVIASDGAVLDADLVTAAAT